MANAYNFIMKPDGLFPGWQEKCSLTFTCDYGGSIKGDSEGMILNDPTTRPLADLTNLRIRVNGIGSKSHEFNLEEHLVQGPPDDMPRCPPTWVLALPEKYTSRLERKSDSELVDGVTIDHHKRMLDWISCFVYEAHMSK